MAKLLVATKLANNMRNTIITWWIWDSSHLLY